MVVSSVPPITPVSGLALGVQNGNEVRAIVHRDLRLMVECRHDVAVVSLVVLALDGEDGNIVVAHQAGGYVILRGEGIRRAEHNVGAAIAQGNHQVRGFGGDVQAGGDANALQWLVLDELLADDLQHLHRLVRPLDALLAQIGQIQILYVTIDCRGCRRHISPVALSWSAN